ncbi:tubulin glycylase 3C-like [Onthophagus taurus]|uniref:tubulin glycylase 3C-like n=1 Tax=Onthophagus taurus TaxID=166361 RepID=UPI0039BE3D07
MELQHIRFLKTCLEEKLTPKFTIHKYPKHLDDNMIRKMIEKQIKSEIKKHYSIINITNIKLYQFYQEMTTQLDFLQIEDIINNSKMLQRNKMEDEWRRKNGKLEQLRKEKKKREDSDEESKNEIHHIFHDRLTNLSKVHFNENEMKILNKSNKYAPKKEPSLRRTALEIEATIKGKPNERDISREIQQLLIGEEIKRDREKLQNGNKKKRRLKEEQKKETTTIQNIKKKVKNNQLIITKGDKNAGLVILDKNEYNVKTETFLNENNFRQIERNPTVTFNNKNLTAYH